MISERLKVGGTFYMGGVWFAEGSVKSGIFANSGV